MFYPLEIFIDFVRDNIPYLNSENREFMISLHSNYSLKKNRKLTMRGILSALPSFHKSIISIKFWEERGWDSLTARQKVSDAQSERTSFKKRLSRGIDVSVTSQKRKNAQKASKERMIENGIYDKICKSKGITYDSLYRKGFTEEEAKLYMKEKNGKFFTERWQKLREGKILFFTNTQLEYYLQKGLNVQEAQNALRERQSTFSLEKMIEKHGYEKGVERWKSRQEKWQKTLSQKTDEEKREILLKKLRNFKRYSRKSIQAFQHILEFFPGVQLICGTHEKFLWDNVQNRIWFYDLYVPELNLLVEYQGKVFHPNPSASHEDLEKWSCPISKKNGIVKLEEDLVKRACAERYGYNFFWLWEDKDPRTFFEQVYNHIYERYETEDSRKESKCRPSTNQS